MKHFGLGVFTLVLILGLVSCQGGEKQQESDPFLHLSGQVLNSKEEAVKIYYGEEQQELKLDSAGNFQGEIPVSRLGMVTVAHARTGISLYLGPGDRFQVNFDAEDFDATLALDGDRLAENEYLLEKKHSFKASGVENWMEVLALPFEEMIAKRDAAYEEVRASFEAQAAEGKFSESFVQMETAFFAYEPLLMELSYPDYYSYIHQIQKREDIPYPAKEVEKRLAAIPTDDPSLLDYAFYNTLLERFYGSVAQELMRVYPADERPSYQAVRWKVIDSLARHAEIRVTLKFSDVKDQLSYRGPVHAQEIISLFEAENPSEKMMAKLAEEKARWEPISQVRKCLISALRQ
ncbi:DUF4369 domain-containing protein [Nitritalea halalkaliphila]|uniref:DUF4369 domain-containing protein n=1 Tax=Nitritalea halalkaliphila TaxID=590849 RepID=UPI0002F21589|nr:DUF4369 domain-containing protein [Nitritalea halalkaliphila]